MASAVLIDGSILIMGGSTSTAIASSDVWKSSDGGKKWVQLSAVGWAGKKSCHYMDIYFFQSSFSFHRNFITHNEFPFVFLSLLSCLACTCPAVAQLIISVEDLNVFARLGITLPLEMESRKRVCPTVTPIRTKVISGKQRASLVLVIPSPTLEPNNVSLPRQTVPLANMPRTPLAALIALWEVTIPL